MKASIPFWTIESVFDRLSITHPHQRRLLITMLQTHERFDLASEQYNQQDAVWIFTVIQVITDSMSKWLTSGRKRKELWLKYCRQLCLLLLEDSDFLIDLIPEKQDMYRSKLANLITQCDNWIQVLYIYKERTSAGFFHEIIEKFRSSGYLYHVTTRLKMLNCLLLMEDTEEMTVQMDYLLHTIIVGKHELWYSQPVCGLIQSLIDTYITKERRKADRTEGTESRQAQKRIMRIITAVAVELMLSGNDRLSKIVQKRAMFYRYLTYIKGSKTDLLLEKAFYCLTAERQFPLEFGWEDLETKEHTLLALKMSHPYPNSDKQTAWLSQRYLAQKGQMRLVNGTLEMLPVMARGGKYLPDYLLPWEKCRIRLPELPHDLPTETSRDITTYQTLWKDIEFQLETGEVSSTDGRKSKKKKRQPAEKDDIVLIRIRHATTSDNYVCRIEDPLYYGEGTLNIKNIVRYRTRAFPEVFRDENDCSYLLKAQVLGVDKYGMCSFSLLNFIDRFVAMSVSVGDVVICRVMDAFPGSPYVTCLSDYGYSVYLSRKEEMPDLQPGDYIEAEITDVRSTGYINGRFIKQTEASFNADDAFADLINSYALQNAVYKDEDPEKEEDAVEECTEDIPSSILQELLQLIDRKSVLQTNDCIQSYNLLSFARLIAVLTSRNQLAEEMSKRLKIVYLLQQFVINGTIDYTKLSSIGEMDPNRLIRHSLLQTQLAELHVLNCMNKSDRNEQLWNVMHTTENRKIEQLARFVLANNLLKSCDVILEQEEISKKIIELLDMGIRLPQLYSFGSEDQHTEFKTSIVFPAGKINVPDLGRQTDEIMQVICGFLNADGGTLYLGVNDNGYASGLQFDLPYFDGSKDKFDLYVRNHIAQDLGLKANSLISVSYPEAGSKFVYAIHIRPCDTLVLLKNVCYQRQGSSTWGLPDDEYKSLCKLRQNAITSQPEPKAASVEMPETSVPPATPPPPVAPVPIPTELDVEDPVIGVHTSQLRKNPVHSYEDGYGIEAVAYLHYLTSNRYMLTDDESWRNDIEFSFVITEHESDGYLLQIYEDGTMIKSPIRNILDKTFSREYKRYAQKKLFWACPMTKEELLLSVVIDGYNRPAFRLDDIAAVKEGTMLVQGAPLTHAEIRKVVQFEVIPQEKKGLFEKIVGQRDTQAGVNLLTDWGHQEMLNFEKIGVKIII
ncbi:MAG: ATP-binding protein [Prevotellaceae bacterium]|nr:ATP-binding protein [Prevotellaceae bacterium]